MNAGLRPEGQATVSFAVTLATILVLGIFAAIMLIFVHEGGPAKRLSISWLGEQESQQAADIAAIPHELSYPPIGFRP